MTDTSTDIEVERRHVVTSTQAIALERLTSLAPRAVYAVHADAQTAGRGREQRAWHDPPGAALMVSIAAQGPWPLRALERLPERVAALLTALVAGALDVDPARVAWKAPNDLLVAAPSPLAGAKLAGILIDAASAGDHVSSVVVGCGVNLLGGAFTTTDGRSAAAFDALREDTAAPLDLQVTGLARELAVGVRALLSE